MSRLLPGLAVGLAPLLAVSGVFAADYPATNYGAMRPAFSSNWNDTGVDANSPIGMSVGLNYWYSKGSHQMSIGGGDYSSNDTSHLVEATARVDDYSTNSYVSANAGIAAALNGTYATPTSGGNQSLDSGHIYYGGADFGYMPLGNDSFHIGGLIGYQYWNDSPDMGRVNYTNGSGSYSEANDIAYQMLRLGITAHANLGDKVDLDANLVVIPYADLRGTYGAFSAPGAPVTQASPGSIYGHLYGAAGQVMVGFRPTKHLGIQLGARAWYLTGPAQMDYSADYGTGVQAYTAKTDNYSVWRYGLLAGFNYTF